MGGRRASKKPKLTLQKSTVPQQQYVVLTCVDVLRKHTQLAELPIELAVFVSELVEDFSKWTLETASAAGLAHLLPRLAESEWEGVGPVFRQLRFRFALTQLYKRVHLGVLQWWLASYLQPGEETPEPDCWEIYKSAVTRGRLDTLKWLQSRNALSTVRGDSHPLYCAHPHVIYWLQEQASEIFFYADLETIAAAGDFAFIKWAHAHRNWFPMCMSWDDVDFSAAIRGHFEMVQWIQASRPRDFIVGALCGAVVGGHVEIARWVAGHSRFDEKVFLNMCYKHRNRVVRVPTSMVQWFLCDYEWDSPKLQDNWIKNTLVLAARCGNLDAVKLLWSSECCTCSGSWAHCDSACAMTQAASRGHLRVVKWLQAFLKCRPYAAKAAARNEHSAVVQWLSGEHWMTDDTVIAEAVTKGHIDVIKLHCNDRPFAIGKKHVVQALAKGDVAMVRCLFDLTGRAEDFADSAAIAANEGHLKLVQWLHEELGLSNCAFDLTKVVCGGHLDVLMYLDLHYELEFTTEHAAAAARMRHFAVLEWLAKQRPSLLSARILSLMASES